MVEGKIHPPAPITTPRLAPWDAVQELCNRLDRLIALLEAWAPTAPEAPPIEWPGWEPVINKLDEIKSQLAELEITVTTTWVAKEPEEIYKEEIRTAGTFYSHKMVNFTKGKRLLLIVDSSLDQSVQIQPLGNIADDIYGGVDIDGPLPCTAGGKITIGFAWDDWTCYVGAKITVAVAPTTGTLTISAVVQE